MSEVVVLLDATVSEVLGVFPGFTEEMEKSRQLAEEVRLGHMILTQRWPVSDVVTTHRFYDARRRGGTITITEGLWAAQEGEVLPYPSHSAPVENSSVWGADVTPQGAVTQLLAGEAAYFEKTGVPA